MQTPHQGTSWHIQGAMVYDPFQGVAGLEDIWVSDGIIQDADLVRGLPHQVVNAQGLWLIPRLTDMHVHFRAPGLEWKEDLSSGSRAAVHGGFTMVATMPNTDPVVDDPSLVSWQTQQAEAMGGVRIAPIGAATKGSQGVELTDLWRMRQSGAVGFSDDGRPIADAQLMRILLGHSRSLECPIIQHAEDPALAQGGVMHEGGVSQRLGLPGLPAVAESVMVWRDVLLAELTGGRLHVAHISTPEALDAVAWAQARGLHVSAEATPHHLLLTDEIVAEMEYQAVTKVNPPLRPAAMREALTAAVVKGQVAVIASDHAPHHGDEKAEPYVDAPFGISGIETSVGTVLTALVHSGRMAPLDLWHRMSVGPHQVLGIPYTGLKPGSAADLTLVDPQRRWTVDPGTFYSKGKNTPLSGTALKGQALATMVGGRWVMREGEVLI